MIYSNAKLAMLSFVYDFVDTYLDREDFQLMYNDTDSMWIAFSEKDPFGLPDKLAPTAAEANYEPNPGLCKQGLEGNSSRKTSDASWS